MKSIIRQVRQIPSVRAGGGQARNVQYASARTGSGKWRGMICTFALLSTLAASNAATYVSGSVTGTWYKTNSPYYVTGNILVAQLNIEPGVTVSFNGDYVFEVGGVLTAVGTTNEPIVFRRNASQGWEGIYFNYSPPGSRLECCVISNSVNSGVRLLNSTADFENCTIANNSAGRGGGVWADVAQNDLSFRNCSIVNNSSSKDAGGIYAAMQTNRLVLQDCVVSGNVANPPHTSYNGWVVGGGMWVIGDSTHGCSTIMTRCVVSSNICSGGAGEAAACYAYGGGAILQAGHFSLENCTFRGNIAQSYNNGSFSDPRAYGGGIELSGGAFFTAVNCTFSSNVMGAANGTYGAGAYIEADSPASFVNCTFAYNSPEAVNAAGSSCNVRNSILFFNNGGGAQVVGGTKLNYCDVQGGFAGTGNINFNPIFRSANDFEISNGSQCIDAGDPNPAYNDAAWPPSLGAVRNDMGAYGGPGAANWIAGAAPEIKIQPAGQSVCLSQAAQFSISAAGSLPLFYQWYSSAGSLSGQTNATLVLSNLEKSDAGPYWVVVSNVWGTVTSSAAELVVYDACIDLRMYAGLTISGQPGSTYVLSYNTDLNNTSGWVPLATNTMDSTGWFYLDMDSPFSPQRFYKAKLKQ